MVGQDDLEILGAIRRVERRVVSLECAHGEDIERADVDRNRNLFHGIGEEEIGHVVFNPPPPTRVAIVCTALYKDIMETFIRSYTLPDVSVCDRIINFFESNTQLHILPQNPSMLLLHCLTFRLYPLNRQLLHRFSR